MPTFAPPIPVAVVAPVDAISFGTGAGTSNGSDLHGQDFIALRRFMLTERSRTEKLADRIVGTGHDEQLSYNPIRPMRRTYVKLSFVRRGRGSLPPYDFQED